MVRAVDRAVPLDIVPPDHAPLYEAAQHLLIAIERSPDSAYVWDDADPDIVWADAPVPAVAVIATTSTEIGPAIGTANPINMPSGVVAGDLLVAFVSLDGGQAVTASTGWTTILGGVLVSPHALHVFSRLADGTATDVLTVNGGSGSGNDYCTVVLRITGHGVSTLADVKRLLAGNTTGLGDPPSVDTGASQNYLWLAAMSLDRVGTGYSITAMPGGYTQVHNIVSADYTAASALAVAQRTLTAQTENPGTFTNTSWYWQAATVAIPPPVGGGPPTEELVWDAPETGGGMTDVVCDFHTVSITCGHPDDDGLVESAEAVITLANVDGRYSELDASGRLVYASLGRRVDILGDADGSFWWLFGGRVTGWDENADGTVTVTAHDGFARLADEVPEWTPGTADQNVRDRTMAILARWSYTDTSRLAVTDVRMGNPKTGRSPLEELQVTALSDGGVLFCDGDGAITYRGRDFYVGRPDQTRVWTFSDNLCDGPTVVWDFAYVVDDAGIASRVELENYATVPLTASATASPSPWDMTVTRTHPEPDLWTYQIDGDRLATDLLARWSNDAARFAWTLYLHDPSRDLWRQGIDLRLGDLVNVVRTVVPSGGGTALLDVDSIVTGLVHEITPEEWVVSVETYRAVAWRQAQLWDYAPAAYDDDTPTNVWSY